MGERRRRVEALEREGCGGERSIWRRVAEKKEGITLRGVKCVGVRWWCVCVWGGG